ncbi:MAG: LptF/LptG family permease [Steroidobacteraceae bacterium]
MIIARYIIRTLLVHMLTVLAALLALISIFNFLEQLDDVGVGAYTLPAAARHALLLVPSWLTDFAPMAAFLGALTGLGRLQQDSELTAMRAAGWSIRRVSVVAGIAGIMLAGAAALAGEYVAPRLVDEAIRLKAELRFGPQMSAGSSGWWTLEGSHMVGIDRRAGFPAVTVIDFDAAGDVIAMGSAEDIRKAPDGSLSYVDYRETRWSESGAERMSEMSHPEPSGAVAALLRLSQGTPRFASLRQLAARRKQLEHAALDTRETSYQLNERVARMVMAPLLVLLAVPVVVGVMRSGRQGARLLLGLAVGFALSIAQDAAHSLVVVVQASPLVLAWLPAATTIIAIIVLSRLLQGRHASV